MRDLLINFQKHQNKSVQLWTTCSSLSKKQILTTQQTLDAINYRKLQINHFLKLCQDVINLSVQISINVIKDKLSKINNSKSQWVLQVPTWNHSQISHLQNNLWTLTSTTTVSQITMVLQIQSCQSILNPHLQHFKVLSNNLKSQDLAKLQLHHSQNATTCTRTYQ